MKTIPVEGVDHRLADALKQQRRDEPVLLTENSKALGVFVRLPERFDEAGVDLLVCFDEPGGPLYLIVQAKFASPPDGVPAGPAFGSCREMLAIASEDDEHLEDFDEYMR